MLVTTTYLEQTSEDRIRPTREPDEAVEVVRAEEPSPEFVRFLYAAVGSPWPWTTNLTWTWQQWYDALTVPGIETWVCWRRGTPAGFAQLRGVPEDGRTNVEITSFGLIPEFIGRGFGGHLLTVALRRAWSLHERWPDLPKVGRVWLHTCTLDGPHALANYQARGLTPYRIEESEQPIGDPPQPWPGADRPPVQGTARA